MTHIDPMDFDFRAARCCCCSLPMNGAEYISVFLILDKKATWKNPVWDSIFLKPGIKHIPRPVSVVCNKCRADLREPVSVVEWSGNKWIYHPISSLEDAFAVTRDMLVKNVKVWGLKE